MAHVQRPGGIGAYEFDLDLAAPADVDGTVLRTGRGNGLQQGRPGRRLDVKIDKTRSGNGRFSNQVRRRHQVLPKDFRDSAGGHLLDLGHDHGKIGREIPMGLDLGHFDFNLGKISRRQRPGRMGLAGSVGQQTADSILHC